MIERLSSAPVPVHQRIGNTERTKELGIKEVYNASIENKKKQNQHEIEKKLVQEVVEGLNRFLQPAQTSIKFELHEKLKEYYVTIVDDNTREVVKEIPAKKMLDTYAAMTEYLGIMVDKKI